MLGMRELKAKYKDVVLWKIPSKNHQRSLPRKYKRILVNAVKQATIKRIYG